DLVRLLHEDGALLAQLVHDVPVVDDLLAHVDRSVHDLERLLDDVDGANDPGAEAAQAGDQEPVDLDAREVLLAHQVTVSANFSFLPPWEAGDEEPRPRSG